MQVSKKDISSTTREQILKLLSQVVADIHNLPEAEKFLNSFLTDVEMITLAKRLAIAYYLEQGQSYEEIKAKLQVSSATIANTQTKIINNSGIKLALNKIAADQWATKWTKAILRLFGADKSPLQ